MLETGRMAPAAGTVPAAGAMHAAEGATRLKAGWLLYCR
jgi:hypothetical protein